MAKQDVIKKVQEAFDGNPKCNAETVGKVLTATFNTLQSMAEGQRCQIRDFGSFSVVRREARKGRNPKTGAEIQIPAQLTMKFKTSSVLKEELKAGGKKKKASKAPAKKKAAKAPAKKKAAKAPAKKKAAKKK